MHDPSCECRHGYAALASGKSLTIWGGRHQSRPVDGGRRLRRPLKPPPTLRSTNPLERFNREIGRRTDVVDIFPDGDEARRRLGDAVAQLGARLPKVAALLEETED